MSAESILVAIVGVLTLNFALIILLRRRKPIAGSEQVVRFFGRYSPVLTWLKYRRLPARDKPADITAFAPDEQPTSGENLQPEPRITDIPGWSAVSATLRSLTTGTSGNFWGEVTILAITALIYARTLLVMHPSLGLSGSEYQAHVGALELIRQWLSNGGEFPLWNPIVGTGRSLIADPFFSLFNPFISVPMLAFGVVTGSKISMLLNFLIAGLGMWTICRILKFRTGTRLWCSILYMMSGAIPAHMTNGQIQLAYALGWLPWSIAGLLWVLEKPSPTRVSLASLAQALFFFTGNLYYQVFALFCLVIIGTIYLVDWRNFRIYKEKVPAVALMVLLSIGLISVQFLPILVSKSSIHNKGGFLPDETDFHGSQRPENAVLNYFVSDKEFFNIYTLEKAPYLQESYRYLGLAPFLLLLLLLPTLQRGHRKEIFTFGLCFLFLLAWAGIKYSFVKELYQLLPFLNQFRWPGRALSVGGLFLVLVSAYCLDFLFASLDPQGSLSKMIQGNFPRIPRLAVSALILLGLWFALRRVYQENGELIYLQRIKEPEVVAALDWISERDSEQRTLRTSIPIAQLGALGMYERGLRSPDIIDGWSPEVSPLNIGKVDAMNFQPKFWIDRAEDDVDHQGLNFLRQFGDLRIWLNPDPFPYAFFVTSEELFSGDLEIEPDVVSRVLDVGRDGFNRIKVELEPKSYGVLVVLESWFTGWRVYIDQQPVEIVTVSNFLAVPVSPGQHLVEFEYRSLAFTVGAWISGFSALLVIGILVREQRLRRTG